MYCNILCSINITKIFYLDNYVNHDHDPSLHPIRSSHSHSHVRVSELWEKNSPILQDEGPGEAGGDGRDGAEAGDVPDAGDGLVHHVEVVDETQQPHLETVEEVLAQHRPWLGVRLAATDHQVCTQQGLQVSPGLLPAGQASPHSLYFPDQTEIFQYLVTSQLQRED